MAVTLNGTPANDDALQQTQVVNPSADITFLGSYGGVILNTNNQEMGESAQQSHLRLDVHHATLTTVNAPDQ